MTDLVAALVHKGVVVPAPDQVFVDGDVDLARIAPTAILHPGTRLHGGKTYIGPRAAIGTEGPAVLRDAILGEDAKVASGFVHGAVLLAGASLGANAHVREGTLLEEQASTAHAVGLKQTILLSFVTLGSLINFCDVLMAGGTSRSDHSEVGSGFIHFNFTPWGKSGDKATASLIGDVVRGVLLDQPRIFLGGAGGMVGPRRVGFGAITAAGVVTRRDVDAGQLVSEPAPKLKRSAQNMGKDRVAAVLAPNAEFIGQLVALRAWYRQVRLARAAEASAIHVTTMAGIEAIDACIAERVKRLGAVVDEQGGKFGKPAFAEAPACPLVLRPVPADHVAWVKALADEDRAAIRSWLGDIAAAATAQVTAAVG